MKKKRMNRIFLCHFFLKESASTREKVAQKLAFRESLILLGFMPTGWLIMSAQGHALI
jgi:hypothetical protein